MAEEFWCKFTQESAYSDELKCLRNGKEIPPKSKLNALAPILDAGGMIWVGGRLENANISYDERHPIIVPGDSLFAMKLIKKTHMYLLRGVQCTPEVKWSPGAYDKNIGSLEAGMPFEAASSIA